MARLSDRQVKTDDAAARLARHRGAIVSLWEERVRREIRAAGDEREPEIIDSLPQFLDMIARALSPADVGAHPSRDSTIPLEHGRARALFTDFSLGQVIHEYHLLRDVVFEVLGREVPLDGRERDAVVRTIDQAVIDAAVGFVRTHEERRERFVAMLSHELRGALAVAKGAAHLLARGVYDPARQQDLLAAAARSLERADRMIRDLLDASQARAGVGLALSMAECELAGLVREVFQELAVTYGDRFVLEGEGPITGLWCADRLRQAVYNLADNAAKYGRPDTPVTVTLAPNTHGRVAVAVHNHGSPIAPEDRASLFEPFKRAPGARRSGQPGWGLGLAMTRTIVEAHGGSIVVESLPDQGTTFTMDLPLDARPFQAA